MAPRVGGPPGPPPQVETPKPVAIPPKPEEKKEVKQETKEPAKTISREEKTARKSEHSVSGQAMAANLKMKAEAKSDSTVGAAVGYINKATQTASNVIGKAVTTVAEAAKPLSAGDKGPAVETAQKDLNKWREANGRKPIQVNGNFNSETEAAVRDFQKANGLNADCIYGPNTRDRLALENDPKFQKLNDDTKKQVREQMKSYSHSATARSNLHELATDSNFGKLSREGQDLSLKGLNADPLSSGNLKNLKENAKDRATLEGDPNFKKLPDTTKKQVLDTMERKAFEPGERHNLMKIATEPGFGKISASHQEQVLKTLARNPASAAYTNQLKQIVGSESFTKMDDALKTRVLNLYGNNAENSRYTDHLANLVSHRNFGAMSVQQQTKTMNLFEANTMDGNAALVEVMKKNINGTPALLTKTIGGGSTLLDNLDRLRQMPLSPKILDGKGMPEKKSKVMEDVLKELANPHRNINQDIHGTCTCTSMTFNLALTNPAEYARIATDLSTNGVAMLAGGVMIAPPADAFAQDGGNRSVSERLVQSALMRYGTGGKYQNADVGTGLELDEQIKVLQALNGKGYKSVPHMPYMGGGMFNKDEINADTKRELAAGRVPVYARLRWDGGGHAVEITKIENGRVYIRNPWGAHIPGVSTGVGGDYSRKNPPRRIEDPTNGIESMSEQDYDRHLKSIVVED